MKELDNIHPDRFYTDLVSNGTLIQESVEGENEDGDINTFYFFEDAIYEAEEEGYTLNDYGEAYYYKDGKIYLISVYIENNEAVGVNEFDSNDIENFINGLIMSEEFEGDEDAFYQNNEWALQFKAIS